MSAGPTRTAPAVTVCNVYIDGYNFYYSISKRDHEFLKLGWCDFSLLSSRLVKKAFPGARVGAVKYFTAPVTRHEIHPGEARRQQLWLDALKFGTRSQVRVIQGYYAQHEDKPRVEKQTDTNLAISMIRDAIMSPGDPRHGMFRGRDSFSACNGVLLVSGDSDFLPAAQMVGNYGMEVAIFRQVGDHDGGKNRAHPKIHSHEIAEEDLKRSMLPDHIPREDGTAITWSEYMELKIASEVVSPEVDRECLAQCQAEAANSDDNETRVGCVIRHSRRGIIVRGHNSLPRGVQAFPPERLSRPGKYAWIEHAERNALYRAARNGIPLRGCTMYVEVMPCVDCARGIIQSDIKEVVVSQDRMQAYSNSAYREQHIIAEVLFTEAGVSLRMA
jgi:dCMP deaminase